MDQVTQSRNNTVKDRFIVTDPGDIRLCSVDKAELYFAAPSALTRAPENKKI
jgi:hypothetical protein